MLLEHAFLSKDKNSTPIFDLIIQLDIWHLHSIIKNDFFQHKNNPLGNFQTIESVIVGYTLL